MNAVVKRIRFPSGRRILAVSDIHGNLNYLKGLLSKCAFTPRDILVLVGDMLEKGPESLETLRYIMELSRTHTVHTVTGNCDTLITQMAPHDGMDRAQLMAYLRYHPESLVFQMAAACGLTVDQEEDLDTLKAHLPRYFPREMAFLSGIPTILETPDYVFVHGGVPDYDNMEGLNAWACMKNDNFMSQGHSFPKFCVVGHWPVTLYREKIPCGDPLIDRARKIASIDGGCCIKEGGQLNALLIPEAGSEDFSWVRYDDYPLFVALDRQEGSADPFSICWTDHNVEILERGEEFSLVRHRTTGRSLYVLTRYLRRWGETDYCEDSTDYHLPVSPGEVLSVVEVTSRGALCKKDGALGWYTGRLKSTETAEKSQNTD